jgi:hypothetical protein
LPYPTMPLTAINMQRDTAGRNEDRPFKNANRP